MNFFRTPFLLPLLYPSLIWKIDTCAKELFITFDDGPVPGPTNFALEVLNKFKAKATFFCIGENIRKHPEIFRRIVEDGHSVGNHTFNHVNGWKQSIPAYLENVELCTKEINAQLPAISRPAEVHLGTNEGNRTPVRFFRPPYGRIKYAQIKALHQHQILMWDVLTFDYDNKMSPSRCLSGTVQATRPGSIILFHDSIKAETNMKYALPRFLEHFSVEGFTFQPLK